MQIYQYAILFIGKKTKDGDWKEKPKIIKEVTSIPAKDDEQAVMLAAREIPQEYLDRLDKVQLVVRPF